jgi:DNA helicase-2/ATP-dependent DNA helicase PcrA
VAERALRERLGWRADTEPPGEAARNRWRNIGALFALVGRAVDAQPDVALATLVADLRRRAAAGHPTADESGAVTLTTLHRVKGLEFDAVFVVGCEDGLLPISHAKTDTEVEEERRLLYVGLTRARLHLWVSYAGQRPGWSGKMTRRRPSSLIPSQLLPTGAPRRDARALRTWRRVRARADDVPAFVIFNDRTLEDLLEVEPRSLKDLLDVHGLGPTKVDRYGTDILRVLGDSGETDT